MTLQSSTPMRRHARHSLSVSVSIRQQDGTQWYARSRNLSLGGLTIGHDKPLVVGEQIEAAFTIAFNIRRIRGTAVVRWTQQQDGYFLSGLEFVELEERLRETLAEVVTNQLDRRKSERLPVRATLHAAPVQSTKRAAATAYARDVSRHGMRVVFPYAVEPGEHMELRVQFKTRDTETPLPVIVRWTAAEERLGRCTAGVEFKDPSLGESETVKTLLAAADRYSRLVRPN